MDAGYETHAQAGDVGASLVHPVASTDVNGDGVMSTTMDRTLEVANPVTLNPRAYCSQRLRHVEVRSFTKRRFP